MINKIAAELCRNHRTGQCAALCLSHFSTSTTDGQCPEATRIWGDKIIIILNAMREPNQNVLDILNCVTPVSGEEVAWNMVIDEIMNPQDKE